MMSVAKTPNLTAVPGCLAFFDSCPLPRHLVSNCAMRACVRLHPTNYIGHFLLFVYVHTSHVPSVCASTGASCVLPTSGHIRGRIASLLGARKKCVRTLYPMDYAGNISNWDTMEKCWRHAFCKLGLADVTRCRVLMTSSLPTTTDTRERSTKVLFEKFGVAGFFLHTPAVLGLYSLGRVSGMVLDCGHSKTNIMPVYGTFRLFIVTCTHIYVSLVYGSFHSSVAAVCCTLSSFVPRCRHNTTPPHGLIQPPSHAESSITK